MIFFHSNQDHDLNDTHTIEHFKSNEKNSHDCLDTEKNPVIMTFHSTYPKVFTSLGFLTFFASLADNTQITEQVLSVEEFVLSEYQVAGARDSDDGVLSLQNDDDGALVGNAQFTAIEASARASNHQFIP